MKLSIIIPVFNEKKTILEILKKIEKVNLANLNFEKEIIIVDDGSTDGTREILENLKEKYKIVFHDKNQGKGMAIRTALERVSGDFVIIQDADLEYDPQNYLKLLKFALENKAEVVYGSRRLNPQNKQYSDPFFFLGGIVLSWLANFLYNIKITDEPTCYKLFKTETLKSIPLKCQRFEFCPEVTAKIAKRKIKIYEVPISYYPRHKKEGKKINWRDGFQAIWTLIKYRFTD
jgi:glycosyltransferase involved in cell wall biosynthesis